MPQQEYHPCANKDEAKNFACAFVAMVIGGIASLAWGVYELGAKEQDEVRLQHVDTYNRAVDHWEAGERAAFDSVGTISIHGWYDGEQVPVTLQKVANQDALLDHGSDLESFAGLHYEFRGSIPISGAADGSLPGWNAVTANLTMAIGGGPRHSFTAAAIPLTKSTIIRTGNWKQCQFHHHGSLDRNSHVCTTYREISNVCITVLRDNSGTWRPTQHGCNWPIGSVPVVPVYTIIPVPRFQTAPNTGPDKTYLRDVVITVRAEDDPFLVALNVNHGNRDFGQTKQQRLSLGAVGTILGVVLLLSGTALAFCFYSGVGCYQPTLTGWERQYGKGGRAEQQFTGIPAHDNNFEQNGNTDRGARQHQTQQQAVNAAYSGRYRSDQHDIEMQKVPGRNI